MHGPIFLSCSGEGRAGVHPGPVPGRLVAGGGVAAHVGCTGGGPHRRPPAPRHTPARGRPQVGFYRVAVLLLTVNFTAKARGKSWQCQGNTCNTFLFREFVIFSKGFFVVLYLLSTTICRKFRRNFHADSFVFSAL
jgi:hypothetical protein